MDGWRRDKNAGTILGSAPFGGWFIKGCGFRGMLTMDVRLAGNFVHVNGWGAAMPQFDPGPSVWEVHLAAGHKAWRHTGERSGH